MHSGVAVMQDGRIACAHPEGHRLLLVDPVGPTTVVDTPLTEMHGIAATRRLGQQVLAVADPGHRFVPDVDDPSTYTAEERPGRAVLLDLAGNVLLELPCPNTPTYHDQPWRPTAVVVDDGPDHSSGDLWVADGYGASLVHRFDAAGNHLQTIDGSESGISFACPHGLMIRRGTGASELYVADRGNRRIVVLDLAGKLKRIVADGDLDSPSSMVAHGNSTYVTELFGGIARLEDDELTSFIERSRPRDHTAPDWPNRINDKRLHGPNPDTGEFNSPHGICTDGQSLFVTEWFIGGRLLRIPLDAVR